MTVGELYERMDSAEFTRWMQRDRRKADLEEQARTDARHAVRAEQLSRGRR